MLEETDRERAIELFLIKYPFTPLDGFPRCPIGHLRSVLNEELDFFDWEIFLKSIKEFMLQHGNSFAFKEKLDVEIPERMLEYVISYIHRYYYLAKKIGDSSFYRILTEVYGHSFFNYRYL